MHVRVITAWALLMGVGPAVVSAAEGIALSPDGTVSITQVQWGFDGTATPTTFVPLSLLVENSGPAPAQGTLRLKKAIQLDQRVDVEFAQEYFVSGFSSRWVQLTPYVLGDYETWTLSWGNERRQRTEIPTPRNGTPATVMLVDPEIPSTAAGGNVLRRFDFNLFPASVTATDGLRGLVMDRVPAWQGARTQAFLDWLRRGGRVHLLHGADGTFPKFSGELAVLNSPETKLRVGAGLVKRVPLRSSQLDRDTTRTLILQDEVPSVPKDLRMAAAGATFGGMMGWERDEQLLMDLERSARFARPWVRLYLLCIVYLAAVHPGCYLLGRRFNDWRVFHVAYAGIAVLFSAGFAWIGGSSGAEQSRVRSAVIARQLEEGLFDVSSWSSYAALQGGTYDLKSPGSGRLYATCQELEAVNGTVHLGTGRLELDMPPMSSRTLLVRSRATGPALGLSVVSIAVDRRRIVQFAVRTGPGFPRDFKSASVWYEGRIHDLVREGDTLRLGSTAHAGINFLYELDEWDSRNRWGGPGKPEREWTLDALLPRLVGNSFGLSNKAPLQDLMLGYDIARVLVFAPLPAEFRTATEDFPDQRGIALYVVDLPVAVAAPSSDLE